MNWEEQTKAFLEANQYHELFQWCEQLIEQGSEGSLPYWYLGLVYLLQGNVEEAQGVWLAGMFEAPGEEDSDERTEQLVSILEAEAERQEERGKLELTVQLREQRQELNPDFNNLLKLALSSIQLKGYDSKLLENFNFLDWCEQARITNVSLKKVISLNKYIIINLNTEYEKQVLQKLISIFKDSPNYLQEMVSIGIQNAITIKGKQVACEVAKFCLESRPDFIPASLQLTYLYAEIGEYQKAIEQGKYLQDKFDNLPEKIQAKSFLLRALLRAGTWSEIAKIEPQYKQLFYDLIKQKENDFNLNSSLVESLLYSSIYLPYLKDFPRDNRAIHNGIGNLITSSLQGVSPLTCQKRNRGVTGKLKIGYMAYTFKQHPVYWLSRWLIQNHNLENFEVILYNLLQPENELLDNISKKVDGVRYIRTRSATAIAQQINQDEIDVLVDLDSLTMPLSCQVLAYKPAPVQVTWLGWDASGLPTIDYFIADPYVLPKKAQEYYQETIWRLPNTYLAVEGFEIAIPTLERKQLGIPTDAVIYYSSQVALKRHPDIIRLQLRILSAVPNSYFLIKGLADDQTIQNLFNQIATEEGVNSHRLRFLPLDPTELTHRANLSIADVVLDTYPYNGATTTLEALWMGVPLVTRVGEQFSARNSYTFLMNAGVTEGIAWSDEEYVEWGVKLGKDEELRKHIHWKLKESRKTSPLWNVKQFTWEMETAYQQMWEKYLNS